MMSDFLHMLSWYLIITLAGVAILPLGFRFFSRLPSRGFALARPLALLIWGFLFWFLASIRLLQNDLGGVLLAFCGIIALGFWAGWKDRFAGLLSWLKQNIRMVMATEGLFLAVFILWTFVRGMNPDAAYTEKPMELAFINSILRSPTFPPQDPWLSGYAISYYYFGYVLIAMITRVSDVVSAVAFNLSSSLWFALTAAALYGVVYDLIFIWKLRHSNQNAEKAKRLASVAGFLGPLFVLIASTYEGLLEILHAGGVFWNKGANGIYTSKFWTWLSIADLNEPPTLPFNWIPSRPAGWLWWRGSRVLQDISLTGNRIEVIDEFPFFTYLLSDLHPHLLAMPFALLAIGISLNFFLGAGHFFMQHKSIQTWMRSWDFWLVAMILGSMAFINTWDFPIYVGLFCFTWAYVRYQQNGWSIKVLWEFLKNGLILGITGVIFFLPFYIGFSSQAGGLLPSLEYMTKGIHFWMLFGVLLVPIVWWLVFQIRKEKQFRSITRGINFALIILIGLLFLSILYGLILFGFQNIGPSLAGSGNPLIASLGTKISAGGSAFSGLHENFSASEVFRETVFRRIQSPGTWLTLGAMLALTLGFLLQKRTKTLAESNLITSETNFNHDPDVEKFISILVLIGLGLTLFPEFFYLRDQFGWRMNTIFKFYFQAWLFWGIAAAVTSVWLFQSLSKWKNVLFQCAWIVSMLAGLAYPVVMLWDKTDHFLVKDWTLNGNLYIEDYYPDDYAAISWLQNAPLGVVSEAVGGSYTDYARISTRSGQPTVLGWPGHESQWRGGGEEMGSRYGDIQLLYETNSWDEAQSIIEKYNIRYIYVGALELSTYRVDMDKFDLMLEPVYNNQSVTIYEVPLDLGDLLQ